eukprot:scaffold322242_cov30-Tisochrysis_lutea.AAC.3
MHTCTRAIPDAIASRAAVVALSCDRSTRCRAAAISSTECQSSASTHSAKLESSDHLSARSLAAFADKWRECANALDAEAAASAEIWATSAAASPKAMISVIVLFHSDLRHTATTKCQVNTTHSKLALGPGS